MEVVIAAVGRPRSPGIREAIADYEARAARYFRLRIEEVPPARVPDGRAERARAREARALLSRIPEGLDRIALTRSGSGMSSPGLAAYLEELATYGRPGAAFLIGGAFGLGEEALAASRRRLALSSMTLPHELARLVLAEQLYRAGTILRGEPYHKGGS